MKYFNYIFLFLCILISNYGFSQNRIADSLTVLLTKEKSDTSKVKLLNEIGRALRNTDAKIARANYNKALRLAQSIDFFKGIHDALMNTGKLLHVGNQFETAIDSFYNSAVALARKRNKKELLSRDLVYIGVSLTSLGKMQEALKKYDEALMIDEANKNLAGISEIKINLGNIYTYLTNEKLARKCYEEAYKIKKEINDEEGQVFCLINLSATASVLKDYQSSIRYSKEAEALCFKIGNESNLPYAYQNLSNSFKRLNMIDSAIFYYDKALKIHQKFGNTGGIVYSLLGKADLLLLSEDFKEALIMSTEALALSKKSNNANAIKEAYDYMGRANFNLGRFKEAYVYNKLYDSINHLLINSESSKQINELQVKFETVQKDKELVEKQAEIKVQQTENQKRSFERNMFIIGFLLMIILAVFIFNQYRNKQKINKQINIQKNIIEEKHREITDSINYAERIQRSFLASKELLDENLTLTGSINRDYFVLFKPKDVVSGDFYWASKIVSSNGVDKFGLVTADSTGHGVPGAIMSLLNITSLESALKDGFTEPSDILNATRKTIIERLRKDGSAEGGKDGMDCSLCLYDFENKKLSIAAAHNPVWIVRASTDSASKEVIEIKPDKMPVGKHDRQDVSFTQQEIQLQTGDVVYTLTDGFPDQFGGEKGKKFMSKNLRELLIANAHLPMQEQKELLETTFANWVGDLEQVDDVTIIGICI